MTSVLFAQSQTLHSKVTIPVALECLRKGWDVTFQVNRPTIFGRSTGFTDEYIRNHPTTVGIINPESLEFVADVIGLGEQWRHFKRDIRFSFKGSLLSRRYDAVIGTTKNVDELRKFAERGVPSLALGYQHIPVTALVGKLQKDNSGLENSVFFSNNAFAGQHGFSSIVAGCDASLNGFTFLDCVFERATTKPEKKDKVLIFHPGGYRHIVSAPGDDRKACYAAQKSFLQRLCIPIARNGLVPVLKIHPLRALHHDVEDLEVIAREVEEENGLSKGTIRLIGPKGWFWDDAFASAFILGFGSSSLYELWCAGLKNVYVGNFEGTARSQKFDFFSSIFLDNYKSFLNLLGASDGWEPSMDKLTSRAYEDYHQLFNGKAVGTAVKHIEGMISHS